MEPALLGSPKEWPFIHREITAKISSKNHPHMHCNIHTTDAKNLLLYVSALQGCHHEGLRDKGTHGVLKHVGDLVHLLCIDYCESFITRCVKSIIYCHSSAVALHYGQFRKVSRSHPDVTQSVIFPWTSNRAASEIST
jgi:hypothetical protein